MEADMRNPNLTQALVAAVTVYNYPAQSDDGSKLDLLADLLTGMYGLYTGHREIVCDVIGGGVPAEKAVKAIRAITALYEDVDA
jgi:hypothetical protein